MPTKPALDPMEVLGLAPEALPRHVAIIMDGNGRWAQHRGLPRIEGHRHAATAVREIVEQCARLGIKCLTLYSFSLENWKRPQFEVNGLMALYAQYLASERQDIMDNGHSRAPGWAAGRVAGRGPARTGHDRTAQPREQRA